MYKCNCCEEKFDKPVFKMTTNEETGHKNLILYLCPYCRSEDISEINLEEKEDE